MNEIFHSLLDPMVLKRKRQKFGGEASHLFRHFQAQEQQKLQDPHQTQDGRQHMGFLNIAQGTAIKAEPRDTSPLPYGIFPNTTAYRMPENSPSPQPLSPPTPLYNLSNTPSPYNMTVAGGNLISPNNQQQYGGAAAAGNLSPNINVDMNDMSGTPYHSQYQAQTQPGIDTYNQMPPQLQQQTHHWSLPPATTNNSINQLLTTHSTVAGNHPQQQQWNLPGCIKQEQMTNLASNPFMMNAAGGNHTSGVQHHSQAHQQDHHQQHTSSSMNISEAPNISSLLDMDSEQLIQLNSAELSGLSLS